ncbi:hypothetical protein KBC99_03185, partial [Candidatus Saccharibacteria bacterium]|nr:hypothetical protein [Candidatus Saccharibacteria bacterium]
MHRLKTSLEKFKLVLTIQSITIRHPYLSAWFVNFCYSAYQMSWMRGTRLTDIAPDVPIVKASFFLVYIIFTLAFSLCLPLVVWLCRRLRINWQEPKALFILPALWIVAEFLQSAFFSLIIYGNYGHIGSYIVIGSLGYNIVQTPLIYLSRLGGLWILTGAVVFFCIAILQLLFVPKARLNILLA